MQEEKMSSTGMGGDAEEIRLHSTRTKMKKSIK